MKIMPQLGRRASKLKQPAVPSSGAACEPAGTRRAATVTPSAQRCCILKHKPSMSSILIRRRVTADLLDLACLGTEFLTTGGRSFLRPAFIPSHTAMDMAAKRLAKAGLIAYRRSRGQSPILTVTPKGHTQGSEFLWPERFWNRKWDGRWYVLMYDVPEKERSYRCALERFFHSERLGCLQKSVWISARDIRPLFDDLDQAASIHNYAILLEAGTVLGQSPKQLAAQAWDFDGLAKRHIAYLNTGAKRPNQATDALSPLAALNAARNELFEYLNLMQSDPLLPAELLPDDYAGARVVAAFRARTISFIGRMFPF